VIFNVFYETLKEIGHIKWLLKIITKVPDSNKKSYKAISYMVY